MVCASRMHSALRLGLLALALASCRGAEPDRRSSRAKAPDPPDVLVLTNSDGVEIWFTLARTAKGPDGKACVERGIEIRHGDTRVKVPLLYTGAAPVLINDSTIRARLWNHCRPGDAYIVDLTSGRPVRDRSGSES
jgi:hypothetical protein